IARITMKNVPLDSKGSDWGNDPGVKSSKSQAPSTREPSSSKFMIVGGSLELEVWGFSGAWKLGLGALLGRFQNQLAARVIQNDPEPFQYSQANVPSLTFSGRRTLQKKIG